MPGALQKDELVFPCSRDMLVDVPQKSRSVAISEIIISANDKRPRMGDFFYQRKVPVLFHMNIDSRGTGICANDTGTMHGNCLKRKIGTASPSLPAN